MTCSNRGFIWRKVKSSSKTLDRRLTGNKLITSTQALLNEIGVRRPRREFVTR
jgi:hypothetical protein